MRDDRRILSAALVVLFLLTIAHAQPRPLTPSDILRVATVGDPQISPTGEWIVYSLTTVEGNETSSNLWLVRVGDRPLSGPPTSRPTEPRRNWDGVRSGGRSLLPVRAVKLVPQTSAGLCCGNVLTLRRRGLVATRPGGRRIVLTMIVSAALAILFLSFYSYFSRRP